MADKDSKVISKSSFSDFTDMSPAAFDEVAKQFAFKITDHVRHTIKGKTDVDPVAKQYVPQEEELLILPEEEADPIGDLAHNPVKGIVHRYPDRLLLKITNVCAVYCRYCFRREMVGPGQGVLKPNDVESALDYIREHPEIYEVILTGGDPLVLSPKKLSHVMRALEGVDHVKLIRFHTRVPVVSPEKITSDMITAMESDKATYTVIHINHVQELTQDVRDVLKLLRKAGHTLLSQSVLLKGVNNDAQVLEDLFRALAEIQVKPYYLHHPDLARGTSHFRVSIEEGQALMKQLQGKISGVCMPRYMLDLPGGYGKVPIESCYIHSKNEVGEDTYRYHIEDIQGQIHVYPPENIKDSQL